MSLLTVGVLLAGAGSTLAAVFVFLTWNVRAGAELLRETRESFSLGPGEVARLEVEPAYGSSTWLRNVRIEHGGVDSEAPAYGLSTAVSTGAEGDDEGEVEPGGIVILHWTSLGELERMGPQRAAHYEPEEAPDPGPHLGRHVFVWEPETDLPGPASLWIRNNADAEDVVYLRVAFVEQLTWWQRRRMRRADGA